MVYESVGMRNRQLKKSSIHKINSIYSRQIFFSAGIHSIEQTMVTSFCFLYNFFVCVCALSSTLGMYTLRNAPNDNTTTTTTITKKFVRLIVSNSENGKRNPLTEQYFVADLVGCRCRCNRCTAEHFWQKEKLNKCTLTELH